MYLGKNKINNNKKKQRHQNQPAPCPPTNKQTQPVTESTQSWLCTAMTHDDTMKLFNIYFGFFCPQ